ncbi:MAG TPA: sensor domain-containing protein [Acidimicrobiales bacterium]
MVTPQAGTPNTLAARIPSGLRAFLRATFAARTLREHAYLAVAGVLALAGLIALLVALYISVLLSITLVGIPLLALTVLGCRQVGGLHRWLANALLGEEVATPRRPRDRNRGLFAWLRRTLGDVDGWRAMAYIVVSAPLLVVGLWAAIVAWGGALGLLAYPVFWQVGHPTNTDTHGNLRHSGMQFGQFYFDTWPRALGLALVGLVAVCLVPWLVRGLTAADRFLVRALLSPSRLSTRVVDLETTRAQAVDASAANLRRIERDLHDGTQARLVALAMHLDMAKEKLAAAEPAAGGGSAALVEARDLLDTAHRTATDAIVELRDVTRSIHPPALDKGLDAALTTLAARSAVPTTLRTEITARPSPAIETIAYFCVAELLTNAAKHSGARHVAIDVTGGSEALVLRVSDDGRGGAYLREGGGLAGLADRVRTVDGELRLVSPPGGPTVVTVELPSEAGRS